MEKKKPAPPYPNSYWLEPNRILCGEYPLHKTDDANLEKMRSILEASVRVFVNLTQEGERKPYREVARDTARSLGIDPDSLEFHRHSIEDASVPDDRSGMTATLRQIRLARHRHKIVYIHCWGGVGRTGTVAGCTLHDLFGFKGEDTLSALQDRWEACEKSSEKRSPETEDQRGYIRSFNPIESTRLQQIRDAVLGAAVGDALGVPVEFQNRTARKTDPVTDMREYGTHHQPIGTWSDDSSMIFATMDGLSEAGSFSPETVMEKFSDWKGKAAYTPHGSVFDIGNATSAAIGSFALGTPPLQCGGTNEFSNGNGSLMRILPIALAYANDPELVRKASEISTLTHAHERSRFCCAFYCLLTAELLHDRDLTRAVDFAWEVMDEVWDFSENERTLFEKLRPERLFSRTEDEIQSGGHVIDTLEAALWVNHVHDSYEKAVLHAVNLGDDTDTTACVAGGLAGLLHGESGIPGEWRNVLVAPDRITDWCEAFAEFCDHENLKASTAVPS